MKTYLSHATLMEAATECLARLRGDGTRLPRSIRVYPIPRGGVPALYLVLRVALVYPGVPYIEIVDNPEKADVFMDDLIDSGTTRKRYADKYPGVPFEALFNKQEDKALGWLVFPWEEGPEDTLALEDDSIVGTLRNRLREEGITHLANNNVASVFRTAKEREDLEAEVEKRSSALLDALLIDVVNDHNTKETPRRMAKLFVREVCNGRFTGAPKITTFPNVNKLDEMIVTGPITVRSMCSHHFCPIIGRCWIAVVPGESLMGLSKFNRVVEWFATRPQIQEELAVQIVDYLERQLKPKGIALVMRATHTCMTWRGVRESINAEMTTNVMRGVFQDKPEARSEFLAQVTA